MAKIIVVDEERCLGCKSCELECALAHTDARTLVEAMRSGESLKPRLHVEPAEPFGMPMQCRHCEDAPCIAICPTEAICRLSPDGPVLLDDDRCIGCKLCMLVCPFGVIDMSRDQKAMIKCDLCIERTEAGELPACVSACPTGAMKFAELNDHLRAKRREVVRRITGGLGKTEEIMTEETDEPDKG